MITIQILYTKLKILVEKFQIKIENISIKSNLFDTKATFRIEKKLKIFINFLINLNN